MQPDVDRSNQRKEFVVGLVTSRAILAYNVDARKTLRKELVGGGAKIGSFNPSQNYTLLSVNYVHFEG